MVSQQQFDDVTAELVNKEQFEELRVRLVAYESQQAIGQAEMQQEVKNQVSEVTEGLKACTRQRIWQSVQRIWQLAQWQAECRGLKKS